MEQVTTKDSQKSVLYREQFEIADPVGDEVLPFDTLRSIADELWKRRVPFKELRVPEIEKSEDNVYLPNFHTAALTSGNVTTLLHELSHAIIAALGKTPFTESHGPLFCYEFGMLWAEYAAMDFEVWRSRCSSKGIHVLGGRPPIKDNEKWAIPEKRNVAVRPARDAVRSDMKVGKIFTNIKLHPLA